MLFGKVRIWLDNLLKGAFIGMLYPLDSKICPVLLVLVVIGVAYTRISAIDFGNHWDEMTTIVSPINNSFVTGVFLPSTYIYPSLTYSLGIILALLHYPLYLYNAIFTGQNSGFFHFLVIHTKSLYFVLEMRILVSLVSLLSVVWAYMTLRTLACTSFASFLGAVVLALSWEVEYHSRWLTVDPLLMHFCALTLLCTAKAEAKDEFGKWNILAAISAGLGCGAKYTGGLLIIMPLSVLLLRVHKLKLREFVLSVLSTLSAFAVAYFLTTPGTLIEPFKVLSVIDYNRVVYSTGHGAYTVTKGYGHAILILKYFATTMLSPYALPAIFFFAAGLLGAFELFKKRFVLATALFAFLTLYLGLFSMQAVMIVRNYLLMAPILAMLAGMGLSIFILKAFNFHNWLGRSIAVMIALTLCANAIWLFKTSESIKISKGLVAKGDALRREYYISQVKDLARFDCDNKFELSDRIIHEIGIVSKDRVCADTHKENSTEKYEVFWVSEARYDRWQANDPGYVKQVIGPMEVNWNYYPTWFNDDRIVVMKEEKVRRSGLFD